MRPCPLNPSPLTTLRRKYRLTMHEAAAKLDLSTLQLARIETATRRIPVRYLKRCAGILVPVTGLVQLSMFDVPEDDEVGERGVDMPDRPDRWADPLTRVIFAAHPQSGLFREFIHFAVRTKLDSPGMFAAADVGSVCRELAVGAADLADAIEVPEAFAYAVLRGWHRPGLRGLAVLADALTVPMDAFFFDDDHALRPQVRRYVDYHEIAPMITVLGGR